MQKTFRIALIEALDATGMPLKRVAEVAGVSYDQLKKLKNTDGATTNVDDAKKVANALGYTLDEMLGDDLIQRRERVAALYRQLTERERAILLAAAHALPAHNLEAEELLPQAPPLNLP